jgi:YggT family protein
MTDVLLVIDLILEIYIWILVAAAVLYWLIGFNVLSTGNRAVAIVGKFLDTITEPVRRPTRYLLPNLGGVDISPIVLIMILIGIRYVIALYTLPNIF